VAKVQAAGGKIIRPTMPIPTIGYFATCQHTEGNLFGIMESDPNAR
jgi:predicted enzyme related to lactoylglutathione lyase